MQTFAFVFSIVLFLVALIGAFLRSMSKYKAGRFLTPSRILFAGVALSIFVFFLPIYGPTLWSSDSPISSVSKTILVSLHHTIRLFAIDSDFDIVQQNVHHALPLLDGIFTAHGAILFVAAPFLTFGVILSFFKNFAAYRKVFFHPTADAFVFSELNEKSVALAQSIRSKDKKSLLIFTDVYEKEEEKTAELLEKVKELDGICFRHDIISLHLPARAASSKIYLFTIGEDDSENISQALYLVRKEGPYRYRAKTRLFVFSITAEGELVLSNIQSGIREECAEKGKKKPRILVKRVNDIRALVNRTLYNQGKMLFDNAIDLGNGEKLISVLVLGTGGQGGEMIKALSWFGQMETLDTKYRIKINGFDKDKYAREKFEALCPELLDDAYNGIYVNGEAQYRIDIHGKVNVDTSAFINMVKEIGLVSYVFVSLGSDELNVKTAVSLRMLFERMHLPKDKTIIQAVVYDSKNKKALENAKNAFGDEYKIDFVGDRDTLYSADIIIDSSLEKEALAIHERYMSSDDKKEDPDRISFWGYEYNYNSSMASAIHNSVRVKLNVPGAGKEEGSLNQKELDFIEVLEHRRWNAYMRSEGYVYSGSKDKKSRNNLGKMHHNLVCYEDLPEEDKRKDSIVATKGKTV